MKERVTVKIYANRKGVSLPCTVVVPVMGTVRQRIETMLCVCPCSALGVSIYSPLSYCLSTAEPIVIVTDSKDPVCVDPEEKGAILEAGGPGLPGRGKGWELASDSGGEET